MQFLSLLTPPNRCRGCDAALNVATALSIAASLIVFCFPAHPPLFLSRPPSLLLCDFVVRGGAPVGHVARCLESPTTCGAAAHLVFCFVVRIPSTLCALYSMIRRARVALPRAALAVRRRRSFVSFEVGYEHLVLCVLRALYTGVRALRRIESPSLCGAGARLDTGVGGRRSPGCGAGLYLILYTVQVCVVGALVGEALDYTLYFTPYRCVWSALSEVRRSTILYTLHRTGVCGRRSRR